LEALLLRGRGLLRQPVAGGSIASAIVIAVILRSILFGGTFTLGELRAFPTFGGAMSNLFAHVRTEGLDPFAPATPGLVALGVLRTFVLNGALAEKLALVLPLVAAGVAGSRIASVLELGPRRWGGGGGCAGARDNAV